MTQQRIILASASPRRKELLKYICQTFDVQSADIDETVRSNETPIELVNRLSVDKARKVLSMNPKAAVIGSDTVVARGNQILGKPGDKNDFLCMMRQLSGGWHQVYTGVALVSNAGEWTKTVCTDVEFVAVSEQDMDSYWQTGEPEDKAGGYAIQGVGGQFVRQIKGSVSAVVGLPLVETKELIKNIGTSNDS